MGVDKKRVVRIEVPASLPRLFLLAGLLGVAAMARGDVTLTTFMTGDKLSSSAINGNFTALKNELEAVSLDLATATGDVTALEGAVTQLDTRVTNVENQLPFVGPRSQVSLMFGNGQGSARTNVHRWATTLVNTGADITYSDSATNGAEFIINTPGVYAISWDARLTGGALDLAITKNQNTDFSVAVNNIGNPQLHVIASATTAGNGVTTRVGTTLILQAMDVIRAVSTGADDPTNFHNKFTITKVSD